MNECMYGQMKGGGESRKLKKNRQIPTKYKKTSRKT